MVATNKVIWREGMFIRPQHFQQQDHYLEALISGQPNILCPYHYGFEKLVINKALLDQGKVALQSAEGFFPDGTSFSLPDQAPLPAPLTIPEGVTNMSVYLCVPQLMPQVTEVGELDSHCRRYKSIVRPIRDSTSEDEIVADIEVGKLQLRLLLQDQDRSHYSCLPLLKIKERRPDNKLCLNDDFIPPLLDISVANTLVQFVEELHGLLQHRANVLAHRLVSSLQSESVVIADFMLLQLTNRYEALFFQLVHRAGLHPETVFQHAVQLQAEVATYTKDSRRPSQQVPYQHDKIGEVFIPLIKDLRKLLGLVLEQHAIAISLTKQDFGIYVARLDENLLLNQSEILLGVSADLAPEILRQTFPLQAKVAAVTVMRDLVSRGLPGIPLLPLAVAPRQIPHHVNFAYFRIDEQHALWEPLIESGSIALHIGGNFPNIRLELWSIRG